MSERSAFPRAGSAAPVRSRAIGMGCVCVICLAALPGLAADAQKWLFGSNWNMMRVTHRDSGVPAECLSCGISSHFFCIGLR